MNPLVKRKGLSGEHHYLFRGAPELGWIICLFGNQMGSILVEIFGVSTAITNFVFILGAILVIDVGSLWHGRIYLTTIWTMLVGVYQLGIIGFILMTPVIPKVASLSPILTFFCLTFLVITMTNNASNFNSALFLRLGWWITGLSSVLTGFLITRGFRDYSVITVLSGGSDRLTLSVIAFGFLVFTLTYKDKTRPEKYLGLLFISISILVIVLCSRKGLFISYIAIIALHIYREFKGRPINNVVRGVIRAVSIISILLVISYAFPQITENLVIYLRKIEYIVSGYFGQVGGQYNSGAIRNAAISESWNCYRFDFGINDYIFGRGYGYAVLDFPILVAFMDFGVLMGCLYVAVAIIYPVRLVLRQPYDRAFYFAQLYTIITVAQSFYSGGPYGQYKFIPIILLYFLSKKNQQAGFDTLTLSREKSSANDTNSIF